MAFTEHLTPHHVHIDPNCIDHSAGTCTEDHWVGGKPESTHPHYVEIDCSTGLVGYTRLSDAEILAKLEADRAALAASAAAEQQAREEDAALRQLAQEDPRFALLLRRLGLT